MELIASIKQVLSGKTQGRVLPMRLRFFRAEGVKQFHFP